jgi:hypothetical protein
MVDIWVLKSPSQVLMEEVEGLLACYAVLTGQTHIFDAFPAEILRSLSSGPKSTAQIREFIVVQVGDEGGSWTTKIEDVLAKLQYLQIVDSRSV